MKPAALLWLAIMAAFLAICAAFSIPLLTEP